MGVLGKYKKKKEFSIVDVIFCRFEFTCVNGKHPKPVLSKTFIS